MARTVVGLYDRIEDARDTVQDLIDAGFDREMISLVTRDPDEGRAREVDAESDDDVGEGLAGGAATGGVLGAIAGVLVGLDAIAIPGVGPILAVGPIAAGLAGAGIGAATGGLIGALADAGVGEEEAHIYAEGVRRGGSLVAVQTEDNRADDAANVMNQHNPVDIEERSAEWREQGWERYDEAAEPLTAEQIEEERARIPVAEEEMVAGKRPVQRGGVRVHSYVVEEPVEEQVRVRDEDVEVGRQPVNRDADRAEIEDAFRERDVEVTETDEEVVTGKRARVTEEVTVGKEVDERTETVRDTVRHTEVDVESIPPEQRASYRQHFESTFDGDDRDYERYEPAYAYGHALGRDDRTRNRNWSELEPTARQQWEREYGVDWNAVRPAVEYGWSDAQREAR